jgi:phosphoglycolate phosphatase
MGELRRRRFKLVVFDWDGTLSDSTTIIAQAIQSACRDLGEPIPDDRAARYVIGLGLADAMRVVAPALPAHRHADLAALYRDHYLGREDDIPLFDGTRELLDELARSSRLLAVATGKTRAGLDRVLHKNGIADRFHATRCADEGMPKPHPEMLLHIMDRLAARPDETLMIGDTTHDLELARNAGVASVAVSYGAHQIDGFARFEPLAILQSMAELSTWLAHEV